MFRQSYDSIIIGMGPAGLAAAYYSAKRNKKVLLIEKRMEKETSLRPQIITLDSRIKDYLLRMVHRSDEPLDNDDVKSIDRLMNSSEISVSALQKYILNRIRALNKSDADNPTVTFSYQSKLESVDLNKGECSIQINDTDGNITETKVEFTHLIGADGAKSESLDLVNKHLRETNKDVIEQITPLKYVSDTYHLGALIKLSRADGNDLTLPERSFLISHHQNNRSWFQLNNYLMYFLRFNRKSYERSHKKSIKLGFVGEIPEEEFKIYLDEIKILEEKLAAIRRNKSKKSTQNENLTEHEKLINDLIQANKKQTQESALSYIKITVAEYFNSHGIKISEDELKVEISGSKKIDEEIRKKKDSLKFFMFKGMSKKAKHAAIEVNGHSFCLIGDASFSPYYQAGHGFNDALEAAIDLSLFPTNKHSDSYPKKLSGSISNYNMRADLRSEYALSYMRNFRKLRWFGALDHFRHSSTDKIESEYAKEVSKKTQSSSPGTFDLTNDMLNQALAKFIKNKFDTTKIINFFINPSDGNKEKLKQKIEDWDKFLTQSPTIAKQFKLKIWKALLLVKKLLKISPTDEEIMKKFNDMYQRTKSQFSLLSPSSSSNSDETRVVKPVTNSSFGLFRSVFAKLTNSSGTPEQKSKHPGL